VPTDKGNTVLHLIPIFLNESSHCIIIECFSSKRVSGTVLIFFSYDLAVLVGLASSMRKKSRIASSMWHAQGKDKSMVVTDT